MQNGSILGSYMEKQRKEQRVGRLKRNKINKKEARKERMKDTQRRKKNPTNGEK